MQAMGEPSGVMPSSDYMDWQKDLATYNYDHFRTQHFLYDVKATAAGHGVQPGELAPDFSLPTTEGMLHLRGLRGKPVLLHFGSPT
jgi:hypothetical protein